MKRGDLVRVKTGCGCFEDGEEDFCYWPESKGQIGMIVATADRCNTATAKVMLSGEFAEFAFNGLEMLSEAR